MKRCLPIFLFLVIIQGLFSQGLNKDSLLVKSKSCNRAKSNITITLENHTGMEILRMNPMSPLQLFKWDGKEWVQVVQVGYCSCGILGCPPPPEQLPFYANDIVAFEWDQMESRCIDMEKGTKEFKWAGKGRYKVVFEFKKERFGESFVLEKKFKIR